MIDFDEYHIRKKCGQKLQAMMKNRYLIEYYPWIAREKN
jgi:hypothetical protein